MPGYPQNPTPSSRSRRLRVMCVDDSPDIASMLARMVRDQPDMEDAGLRHDAEGLAEQVRHCRADVLVVDLTMPGPSPLEAIRSVSRDVASCRIIAYSGYDDPDTRDEALDAGASELVSKNGVTDEIINAIRRVADNPRGPTGSALTP